MKQFQRLVNIVQELRNPDGGCPWDLEQTHESLLKYLIEESYEFVHATEKMDYPHMEEELGDVLLQILLHTTIAQESQKFTLESVAEKLADKLVFRHPHVFKKQDSGVDAAWVTENWEKMKELEKQAKKNEQESSPKSRIDEANLHFPALYSAYKIGKKTKKLKFDWENASEVLEKVQEELDELKVEINTKAQQGGNEAKIFEEMGDFLFSMAQLSRHLGHDPEAALRSANKKFLTRFQMMEQLMEAEKVKLESLDQQQMDVYWNQVKAKLKGQKS